MDLYFSRFIAGINDSLEKIGNENIFELSGTIFPNIESQVKWQYAKTPTHIHLHDGNVVHAFHMPEGYKQDEDFPLEKMPDLALHEFGHDAAHTGSAQIHRADPGSIYFTVQDGHDNPTFTFKHVTGGNWRAMPKVKHHDVTEKAAQINEAAFVEGVKAKLAEDGTASKILDAVMHGAGKTTDAAISGGMSLGNNPLMSAGAGLLGGAAYDLGKRKFYNSEEENEAEDPMDRIKRYLIPTVAAGGAGMLLHNAFPNYYNESPIWKP